MDIGNRLTLYPTIVVAMSDNQASAVNGIYIYIDRVKVCPCISVTRAVSLLYMVYYVFNIMFPRDMSNTFNFLDAYVARISKASIKKSVQRVLNYLL